MVDSQSSPKGQGSSGHSSSTQARTEAPELRLSQRQGQSRRDLLRTLLWGATGLGVGVFAVHRAAQGNQDSPTFFDVDDRLRRAGAVSLPRQSSDLIRIAGSGSNIPLTKNLIAAFEQDEHDLRVVLFESIGSGGGIRAVVDEAIDLGLTARGLHPEEELLPLQEIPYARTAVALMAHPSVPEMDLSFEQVLELYSGKRSHWDNGLPVTMLQRQIGDSTWLEATKALTGFKEVDAEARQSKRWRVLYDAHSMQEALLSTVGAVGMFDVAAARTQKLPLHSLSLNGMAADDSSLASGEYPMIKRLSFVVKTKSGTELDEKLRRFLDFVQSPQGEAIVLENGYLPETALHSLPEPSPARARQ